MFVGNSLSACAVAFTKLSIISSYLRVFPHQSLRVTMFITMTITIGLMLASIPVTVFQCEPVRAAWDFTITNGRVSADQVFDILPSHPSQKNKHNDKRYSATISSTSSMLALRSTRSLTSYFALYLFDFYGPSRYRKSKRLLCLSCSSWEDCEYNLLFTVCWEED